MQLMLALCIGWQASAMAGEAEVLGLVAPEGFEVSLWADDALAHDIFSMTVDPRGRVFVSGPGYIKILEDTCGDGRADAATLFADRPRSGAQGLLYHQDSLYYTGDGGLWRLTDRDGDNRADGPGERLLSLNNPEHGAHAIVLGPDGWLYVICGNDAGVQTNQLQREGSPITEPTAGLILRVKPDGSQCQIVADGFRNPYDLAFNERGDLFTVDSDGERCQHLPWYEPTRVFHVAAGQSHGWILPGWQRSWSRPAEFFDNVTRLAELGRGSPTGLLCYEHEQFPPRYQEGLFSACWSLGKVYFIPLVTDRDQYRAGPVEEFLHTTGRTGFAPVDLATTPEGELLVAIGGRRTRGGIFRVRHTEVHSHSGLAEPTPSWDTLAPEEVINIALDETTSQTSRIRAVEQLLTAAEPLSLQQFQRLAASDQGDVVARLAWLSGRSCSQQGLPVDEAIARLAKLSAHDKPAVRRAAWEATLECSGASATALRQLPWHEAFSSDDARTRAAAITAARRHNWSPAGSDSPGSSLQSLAELRVRSFDGLLDAAQIETCLTLLSADVATQERREAVRLLQLALGDVIPFSERPEVFVGYEPQHRDAISKEVRREIATRVAEVFPSTDPGLNRELARLLAMLAEPTDATGRILAQCAADSEPAEDIHYLTVLACLPEHSAEAFSEELATALIRLPVKMRQRHYIPSREWPDWVAKVFQRLIKHDPQLTQALVNHPEFGEPGHTLYVEQLAGDARVTAIGRLLATNRQRNDQPWSSSLIRLLAELPADEALPVLREQWDDFTVRDSVALALAQFARQADRPRLLEALVSPQTEVVQQAASALAMLPGIATADEIALVLRALRQFALASDGANPREQQRLSQQSAGLQQLLAAWSGRTPGDGEPAREVASAYRDWTEWFQRRFPDNQQLLAPQLQAATPLLTERLEQIDWSAGDLERGRELFYRQACHGCHQTDSRLGPDLSGVTARFSREDLFTAIAVPDLDVSPLYQTMLFETEDGQLYQGLIAYESPDATLLRTGPNTAVRFTAGEIVLQVPSRRSLMPAGLLDGLTDADLADLDAYLRSLEPAR